MRREIPIHPNERRQGWLSLPQTGILSGMNQKAFLCVMFLASTLVLVTPLSVLADDTAVSIAAGGLVPRRETRVVMAKEVLRISNKIVVVDYDFRNDSDQDVTTEVAFPIPTYTNEFPEGDAHAQSFQSFELRVDGKRIHYKSEAKATINGKDVSAELEANHIDIATFGHFDDTVDANHQDRVIVHDFDQLSKAAQSRLLEEGLFKNQGESLFTLWTVHLQYYWTQIFPAHSITHIRHEYSPAVGFTPVSPITVEEALTGQSAGNDQGGEQLLTGFCVDRPFLSTLAHLLSESKLQAKTEEEKMNTEVLYPHWVDFILTSANAWQRPIEDFTLIVERPKPNEGWQSLVSFCSPANGKVEKLDADHFQVHLTNFVPTSELHIGLFEVPLAKPELKK